MSCSNACESAKCWSRTSAPTWPGSGTAPGEPAFFAELARRTGYGCCWILNNLVVNARNLTGCSPTRPPPGRHGLEWTNCLPASYEIHLAGYTEQTGLLIDDHATGCGTRSGVSTKTLARAGPGAEPAGVGHRHPLLGCASGRSRASQALHWWTADCLSSTQTAFVRAPAKVARCQGFAGRART